MAQNKKAIHTALPARFSALGDVAMTVPVIYSACRCHPDVRFVMVTRPSMTSIFVDAPENLVLEGIDVKNEYAGVGGIRRLAAYITGKYSPDVFIDLHNVLRTRILAVFLRLSGIKAVHIFKPRAKRRALTRRHSKVMLPLISQRARYREAFFKAGLPATEHFDGLFDGHGSAPDCLYEAISLPKPEGEKWIGFAPFAAHKGKIYPPDQMEKVVARFQKDADAGERLRLFLFGGGAAEQEILDRWASEYDAATSLAGKKYGFRADLPDPSSRRHGQHGLREYAPQRYRRHTDRQRMGRNAPLLRVQRLASAGSRHGAGPGCLPPVLCVRRQALLPRRLYLSVGHKTGSHI